MDFDRLVSEHKDAVYRQMVRVCGNHADAEDALAVALVKAYRASSDLREREAFQAWLAQIARRACGRLKRKGAAEPLIELDALPGFDPADDLPDPLEKVEMDRLKRCVSEAVDDLSPEHREVYLLRDVEGFSGEETAKRLGIGLPAMKSRLHRARAELRRSIDAAL